MNIVIITTWICTMSMQFVKMGLDGSRASRWKFTIKKPKQNVSNCDRIRKMIHRHSTSITHNNVYCSLWEIMHLVIMCLKIRNQKLKNAISQLSNSFLWYTAFTLSCISIHTTSFFKYFVSVSYNQKREYISENCMTTWAVDLCSLFSNLGRLD